MKDFKHFGLRVRKDYDKNYWSLWYNLTTIRLDIGETKPLLAEKSEFYDVGLGTKCNAKCPFCYVSANNQGEHWTNVVETWDKWINSFSEDTAISLDDKVLQDILGKPTDEERKDLTTMAVKMLVKENLNNITVTEKPYQIAIGSTCEPTIHPEFSKFLEAVYNSKVVPNYTTNGILLSDYDKSQEIIEATSNFCGGVAVSYGNKSLRNYADKAIENLLKYGNCKVMMHHIISDKDSVDDFIEIAKRYDVHFHVLLPLMKHGRSVECMTSDVYPYLAKQIEKNNISNIALGANFKKFIVEMPNLFETWELPEELYSKNILLKDEKVVITPSSFDLNPIKIITV